MSAVCGVAIYGRDANGEAVVGSLQKIGLGALLSIAPVATASTQTTMEKSSSFLALRTAYHCLVTDRLEATWRTGDRRSTRDRFVALTVPHHPHGYVQCLFYDRGGKLLCEAASGFYRELPNAPRPYRLPDDDVAALAKLGFSTDDSTGNFRIEMDLGKTPEFTMIADFMLRALHDGYGASAALALSVSAPLASRTKPRCTPEGANLK